MGSAGAYVLFLDSQHRLIEYSEMFRGTIDSASVYPREVVKEALALVDVRTLNHIIVAGADTTSFSERGLL
jgi:DNA repair protein RadC